MSCDLLLKNFKYLYPIYRLFSSFLPFATKIKVWEFRKKVNHTTQVVKFHDKSFKMCPETLKFREMRFFATRYLSSISVTWSSQITHVCNYTFFNQWTGLLHSLHSALTTLCTHYTVHSLLHYWIYTHFYTLCKTARIYNDFTQKVETTFSNYQTQNANRLSEEQRTLGCIVGNETREHVFCLLILVTWSASQKFEVFICYLSGAPSPRALHAFFLFFAICGEN